MKKAIFFSFALFLFQTSLVWATPAQILIIRHGEKSEDGNGLSERGFARARALVQFFSSQPSMLEFGTPVAIYAGSPDKPGDPSATSRRSSPRLTR